MYIVNDAYWLDDTEPFFFKKKRKKKGSRQIKKIKHETPKRNKSQQVYPRNHPQKKTKTSTW